MNRKTDFIVLTVISCMRIQIYVSPVFVNEFPENDEQVRMCYLAEF